MLHRIPRVVAALGLLASVGLSQADTINIAVSGAPTMGVVVVASNTLVASDTTTKTAAYYEYTNLVAARDDLAATLSQITGGTFTTGTYSRNDGPPPNTIAIGKASDLGLTAVLPSTETKDAERFIIATANSGTNRNLIFAGVTTNGAVDGVYDLLEQVGCRWYFTTPNWQKIPSLPNLSWTADLLNDDYEIEIGGSNVTMNIYQDEQPDYVSRYIWFPYYGVGGGNPAKEWLQQWNEYVAWSRRNRNVEGVAINFNHNYESIVLWAKSQTTDPNTNPPTTRWKPEYYACISGSRTNSSTSAQRIYQFCAGNTEVIQLCKDYTDAYFTNPKTSHEVSVSMEPNDGNYWCDNTCTVCSSTWTISDKAMLIANTVAEHVEANWPGKYVGYLAYGTHGDAPTGATDGSVNDRLYVNIATGYLIFGKTFEQLLAEWNQLTPNIGIYDYFSNFTWDMGLPNRSDGSDLSYIRDAFPAWFASKADNYNSQSTYTNGMLGLGHYIAMKVLWDTTVNVEALRDEFITDMFGDAAAPMDEFYKRIDKGNKYQLSTDLIGRLYLYLHQAYEANASGSNDPAVEARLDDLALWVRSCELRRAWEATAGSSKTVRTNSASTALVHSWKMRATSMLDTLSLWTIKPVWSDSYPGAAYPDEFAWPLNTGTYPVYTGTSGTYFQVQANTYELNSDVPMVASSATTRVTLITTTGTYPNHTPTGTYPLTWVRLYPEGHPWKATGSAPYTHSEILTMVADGTANNPLLLDEPRTFGTDMVPSGFPALTGTWRGSFPGQLLGKYAYYLYTDTNGNTPAITLGAGKVGNINKGNLDYMLCSADGSVEISGGSVVNTAPAGPIVTETLVWTGTEYGLLPNTTYLLTCDDHGSYSTGTWAAGAKISVAATAEFPHSRAGGPTHRYFYVPKGTSYVILYAYAFNGVSSGTGTPNGSVIFSPSATNFSGTKYSGSTWIAGTGGVTRTIAVGPGQDDRLWDARSMSGNGIVFLNIPGLMAPSPQELLIPKDAIDYLVPLLGTSGTSRGAAEEIENGQKGIFYIYSSSATLPSLTVTNHDTTGQDTWALYAETGTAVLESGTVPAANGSPLPIVFTSTAISSSNAYRFVYDCATSGATIEWSAGQKVSAAADAANPYSRPPQGHRYFFVPKGTTAVTYAGESTGLGYTIYNAAGVTKQVQAASATPYAASIPVDAGEDDQVWRISSPGGENFRFTNIPGHLALRPDELLVPRWTFLD